MSVFKARVMGFCGGGKRSVDRVLALLEQGEKVFVYGELLHNKNLLNRLAEKGMVTLKPDPNVKVKGKLVIRAHGIPDNEKQILEKHNEVVDLTCPKVIAIKALAMKLEADGHHIVYFGKRGHPEAEATVSSLSNCSLIENLEDAKKVKAEKIALIAQSTASFAVFETVASYLQETKKNVVIYNTICSSTLLRQKSAREIAEKVELMIVLGGKKSSNTKELAEVCSKLTKTIWIESPLELQNYRKEIKSAEDVGLTAGASTPNEDIEKAYRILIRFNKNM